MPTKSKQLSDACEKCISSILNDELSTASWPAAMTPVLDLSLVSCTSSLTKFERLMILKPRMEAARLDVIVSDLLSPLLEAGDGSTQAMTQRETALFYFEHALRHDSLCRAVLERFARSDAESELTSSFDGTSAPPRSVSATRRARVQARTMILVLSAALRSQAASSQLPIDFYLKLLRRQAEISTMGASIETACATMTKHRSPVSILEPLKPLDSRRWRDLMNDELDAQAQQGRKTIIGMFGGAFQDMEKRCREAEKPWREEVARHENTRAALEVAQARINELERLRCADDRQRGDLKSENARLTNDLKDTYEQLDDCLDKIAGLEKRLEEAQDVASAEMEKSRKEIQRQDTHHHAAMGKITEQSDELRQQLDASHTRIRTLESEAERRGRDMNEKDARISDCMRQQEQLHGKTTDLEAHNVSLRTQMKDVTVSLEQQKADADQQLEHQTHAFEREMETLKSNAHQAELRFRSDLAARDKELGSERSSHAAELQGKISSLREFERRIRVLNKELHAKQVENTKLHKQWTSMQSNMQRMLAVAEVSLQ